MSTIYVKDLAVEANHGVHQREKETSQTFIFNLELSIDTAKAAASDNLADTIDYSELLRIITETTQHNSFNLIERLAQTIADKILSDRRVRELTISIDKPNAFKQGVPGIRLTVNQPATG